MAGFSDFTKARSQADRYMLRIMDLEKKVKAQNKTIETQRTTIKVLRDKLAAAEERAK